MRIQSAVLGALLSLAPAFSAAQSTRQSITIAQFKKLTWFVGSWRGSGGNYPSFFEEYRLVNDSTVAMRSLSDSTFRTPTDSSFIELRNGRITSRGGGGVFSDAVAVTDTSVRFMRRGATTGGWTFTRVNADQWVATIHAANPGGRETVYVMRRVRKP
ncbi:MAG TPA: hypothetical protein VJR92_15435 [Gemmatimonadaceae bacterium]|nr:hypothetical protein [Gemmatimonadaceae bacterium]